MTSIFDYLDYRDYLQDWILSRSKSGHGLRKKMAEHLACQGAFVSQVLHKTAHLSLEHGYRLNQFLQHSQDETEFFMLLLQFQKSGSDELRSFFHKKIDVVRKSRLQLKNRIRDKSKLSVEDKRRYYSSWYYGAIRLLVMIPEFQTKEEIITRLKLSPRTVSAAIAFLIRTGLIKEVNGRYTTTETHLHLGNDASLLKKHHTNWRLKALQSLDEEQENELHYSLSMTLSKADMIKLKAMIIDFIEKMHTVVRPSDSEILCGFCLDWFLI